MAGFEPATSHLAGEVSLTYAIDNIFFMKEQTRPVIFPKEVSGLYAIHNFQRTILKLSRNLSIARLTSSAIDKPVLLTIFFKIFIWGSGIWKLTLFIHT